jgi:arylsulfatase A-like enzyme
MVTYLDKQIGRLMQVLKELDIENQTLVIFSSDNGATFDVGGVQSAFFNSTMDLRGRKMDLYEGGIRAPMIARWPKKILPKSTSALPSAQYDVLATIAEVTHQTIPESDGISFLPTLLGKPVTQKKHPYLYFEFPEKDGQIAIISGFLKGVKSNIKKNPAATWELYDLEKDPFEKNNIIDKYPDKIKYFDEIVSKNHTHPVLKEWDFVDQPVSKKINQ